MLDFLRTWITNIAVIIIFAAFLEMLLPNSDMKRYVKVIIGLLVLLVIIKPFIMIKDINMSFKHNVLETSRFLDRNTINDESSNISVYQNEQALELYKANLKKQIIRTVLSHGKFSEDAIAVNLDIENNMTSQDFGKILNLEVEVKDVKGLAVQVNNIERVIINPNKKVINSDKHEYNFNDKIEDEIMEDLSSLLGMNKSSIKITIRKQN